MVFDGEMENSTTELEIDISELSKYMEKEKNDKVEPDKAPKEKKPLTEEQRIKRNKMIAGFFVLLVCHADIRGRI